MPGEDRILKKVKKDALKQIGAGLVLIGISLLIDLLFRTGWFSLAVLVFVSFYFFTRVVLDEVRLLVVAGLFAGATLSLFVFFNSLIDIQLMERIGATIMTAGMGFILITIGGIIMRRKISWWALFIGWVVCSVGMPFIISDLRLLDFILWVVTGVGTGLLIWGLGKRLFGLIIPGSILSSVGAGVYSAWSNAVSPNGLTETGIMLVWFALGCGAIIVFSRVITTRFVWWPLIPGGILAVVGWGLYSGGNPNNALSFIGNTGSIGVLIFGLYLLLLRRGMKN